MSMTRLMLAAALIALLPADAWAYIDPGTGSYLFQLAIAGLAAGLYTLRRYWHDLAARVRAVGRRLTRRSRDPRADGME